MPMNEPLITIYLPCHNYGRYLKRAIESVLNQTYTNWELLIFDENSSDNTQEVLNLFRGIDKIRFYKTEGIGLINVANRVIKEEARGEYVIRLDADDIFDEDILLVLSRRLQMDPEVAFVFPDYYLIDEYDHVINLERREKVFNVNNNPDVPAHGACTLFRLSALKEVGGYNSEIKAQDGYYVWNKILSKYKCTNVNLPLFFYRRHETNLTNQSTRILTARRKIKLGEIEKDLQSNSPINVVIPCRENYDFRKDVWSLDLGGKTLLEHSIESCLGSSIWDNIIIACDNEDVQSVISKYEDERLRFFKREKSDTIRNIDMSKSLDKVANVYDPNRRGITVINYVQSPFVSLETLEESVYTLLLMNADSAFTVKEIKNEVFKRGPHGLISLNPPSFITSDFEVLFKDTMSAFASRTINFSKGSLLGSKVTNYYTVDNESLFVDDERKYKIAKSFLE